MGALQYINDPIVREHVDSTLICSREDSSFEINPAVLISREGYLVFKSGDTYQVGANNFILQGGKLIYGDLSIQLQNRATHSAFDRLLLGLGYPISSGNRDETIDIMTLNFRDILHVLTMMALKDANLISNQFTMFKQNNYGIHLFEVYLKSVTGKGTIKAKNEHVRWLNEQDTKQLKAKLFTMSGYQVGVNSMEYKTTDIADNVFMKVFDFLSLLNFKENNLELETLDFRVTQQQLKEIKLRDVMLLLSNCIGYHDGFIIRPVLTDNHFSRVYSIFTSIGSETRKALGFTNYDIGSAMQSICLQLVDEPNKYPLHQRLQADKQSFREAVSKQTEQDMAWVKTELSKIDNLDKMPKRYNQYPILKEYFDEALPLRAEIIDNAESEILERATWFAKPNWIKVWNSYENEYNYIINGIKESSLYFFIWTQYERMIREVMMSCFDAPKACHQVHDGVYSMQDLDPKVIEDKVLKDTGFVVKISKD